MQITFSTSKLQKLCSSEKYTKSFLTKEQEDKLRLKLSQIRVADSLADLSEIFNLNCHPLSGKRKGQYAINLDEKYRIVFIIADYPIPRLPDGGINRTEVCEIEIIYVGDYH